MSNILYNIADKVSIAPSAGAALSLTLGDRTFSEPSAADVATTIDNFITSFGFELNQLGVLVIDDATAADFYGLGFRDYSSTNTVTVDATVSGTAPFDVIANSQVIASADNVHRFTVSTGGNNTATVTLTYFDADSRSEDVLRILAAQGRGDSIVRPSLATQAVRA